MEVQKLGFGLMRLPVIDENPEDIDIDQLSEMVDTFIENGNNYFDTSYVYHNGYSESAIRQALVERYPREEFFLASKLPVFALNTREEAEKIFYEQLEKTGAEYFDYYLLHNLNGINYDSIVEENDLFEMAQQLKSEGKIKHVGFSFHDAPEVLDRILTEHPEVEFVQIVINYYDWDSYLVNAKACYDIIRKHGKDVIIMEPVKGGLLAELPEETVALLEEIEPGMSPASYAIRFGAGLDGVLTVLSGMSTLEQVEDNVSYMKSPKPLSQEQINILFDAVPKIKKNGPLKVEDFSIYEDIDSDMPVAAVLDAYNSCMIQADPGFATENNYYKGIQYLNGKEVGESWISENIVTPEGEDITDTVKEAEDFLLENTF